VSAAYGSGAADGVGGVAGCFVEARLSHTALPDYPGQRPVDMDRAYATQEAAIALFPDEIVGWKVGMVPPGLQPELKTHRLSGPIFRRNLWTASSQPTPLPAIDGGFAAVEAEFVARVGPVDPAKTDWTLEEATAAVVAMYIGVELAGSPLATINDLGSAVVASDFGNNGGLVLGPEIEDWAARLDGIEVETLVDGASIGVGTASSIPAGVLESVRFLIEHLARRGRPVTEGTLISTGAVTGVHQVAIGARSVCAFSGVGEIRCSVVAAGT
jgi:2-keto-4-pentenoate hydratase